MNQTEKRIIEIKKELEQIKQQLKSPVLIDGDDEYQEQLELRYQRDDLEAELDMLLEQSRAEEEIEGWG